MSQLITRVTAEDNIRKGQTLEISKLSDYGIVAKFRDVHVMGVKGQTDVVVYVIDGSIVLRIESRDGEEYNDDCILVDGDNIVISEGGMSNRSSYVRSWRSSEKKFEPLKIEK